MWVVRAPPTAPAMTLPRWPTHWRTRDPLGAPGAPGAAPRSGLRPSSDRAPAPADFKRLLRALERKRRLQSRALTEARAGRRAPLPDFYERATFASFRLDGLDVSAAEVCKALAHGAAARACRPVSAQRIRNHVAILRHIERLIRSGRPLGGRTVIRGYTSVACGLSGGWIDDHTPHRLEQIVSAMNSPQLRLWPAVQEIATVHVRLLSDPFVPGFNGILARLLLRYHLGRCDLPPVVFDADHDRQRLGDVTTFLPRLLELLDESYEALAKTR